MKKYFLLALVIMALSSSVCSAQWVVGYSDNEVTSFFNDEHFALDRYQGTPIIVIWGQTVDNEGLISLVSKEFVDLENNRYMLHEITIVHLKSGEAQIIPMKAKWKPIETDTPHGRFIITALNSVQALRVVQPFTDQRPKL